MSAEKACLVLRLEGPLQAWGTSSQYNRRMTDALPSRSAVSGIICAALGMKRGSAEEEAFLHGMTSVHMFAVAVPRHRGDKVLHVRRLEDFHTVQNTARANGGALKDCHITRRQYLLDASFKVFLSGDRALLETMGAALQNPVWGIWLGRKSCIPSAPVFAGIFPDEQIAVTKCIPDGLDGCLCSRDAPFLEGTDSIPDMPVCFKSTGRSFALRRIRMGYGEEMNAH